MRQGERVALPEIMELSRSAGRTSEQLLVKTQTYLETKTS